MTTGRVTTGRVSNEIGRCGNSMLRPWPNHGTLWLHNDNDDECINSFFKRSTICECLFSRYTEVRAFARECGFMGH